MMIFDTHAHLDDAKFDADREDVIKACFSSEIGLIMNIGCDMQSSYASVEMAKKFPNIYAAVGVHPHYADAMTQAKFEEIKKLSEEEKVCAIGEIGLDYYYDNSDRESQKFWFEKQLAYAVAQNMPVVIHNRDSHKDCLDILRKFDLSKAGGVVHCFSGSVEMAQEVIKMGLYISVGGALTFKNAVRIKQVIETVPLERILLETDCPYMTPEPFRGKRNDPSKTILVAQAVAEIKKLPLKTVVWQTMQNGCKLFNIKEPK